MTRCLETDRPASSPTQRAERVPELPRVVSPRALRQPWVVRMRLSSSPEAPPASGGLGCTRNRWRTLRPISTRRGSRGELRAYHCVRPRHVPAPPPSRALIAACACAFAPPAAIAVGTAVGLKGFVILGVWLAGSVGALATGTIAAGRSRATTRRHRQVAVTAGAVGLLELILFVLLVAAVLHTIHNPPSIPL